MYLIYGIQYFPVDSYIESLPDKCFFYKTNNIIFTLFLKMLPGNCLSEIVRENYLLSIRIPNQYSDSFGIPKFRNPIGTSSGQAQSNICSGGPARTPIL